MKNPIMIESRKPGEPKANKLTQLIQSIRKMRQRVQVDRCEISKRLTALGLNEEIIDKLISHGIEPLWCIGFDHPIDISLPVDDQLELLYRYAYIEDAGHNWARGINYKHRSDVLGLRLGDFLPRSIPENVSNLKKMIWANYSLTEFDSYEVYANGAEKIAHNVTLGIILDGRLYKILGVGREITEFKLTEKKLKKTQQRYRTVADFTYDWEYWEAPDGTLIYVSPSCERITGYKVSEFIERPELIFEIVLPEDRDIYYNHNHGIKDGTAIAPGQFHFRIQDKDGHIRWIAHVCQPVFDDQGNYAGVRASNRDVTNLRNAEQKAREYRETLAQLDRTAMLGQLAGSIAHELNQPLTGILSNAQAGELLLQQENSNTNEMQETLADVIADAKRAADVIRNLRSLFGMKEIDFKPLSLNAQIKEALRLLNSDFVINNVTIYTELSDALPNVMANGIQLQQVLINLISNAIQAMQQSTQAKRSISIITAKGNGSEIQVHVEDSGPGIDPERLEGIFEPLTTSKPGGLGMGLSICCSIAQAHGGRIWAENIPEGGARISFTLPAAEKTS